MSNIKNNHKTCKKTENYDNNDNNDNKEENNCDGETKTHTSKNIDLKILY